MALSQVFLNWRRPLVEEVAERLIPLADGSHPADFGGIALVLPTAEAGRQLRTALLEALDGRGGITRLRTLTAEALLHPAGAEKPEADDPAVLVCWSEVLRGELANRPGECRELFPARVVPDLVRDAALRLAAARRLHSCRLELAGAGWSLAGAVSCFDDACKREPDEEWEGRFLRFREFLRLETLYRQELAHRFPGVRDPAEAVLAAIGEPHLPPEIEKLIVIDSPHLERGTVMLLRKLEIPVEIWINAPEEYAEHFDEAGRPEPEFWHRLPMAVDAERTVRFFVSPEAQARKLRSFAALPEGPPAAFGVLDPEVAEALRRLSETDPEPGHPVFYWPQPRTLAHLPWSRLVLSLLSLAESDDPSAEAVGTLFAFERFRRGVCRMLPVGDWRQVLTELDLLRKDSLAPTLGGLIAACTRDPLRRILALCRDWGAELRRAASPVDALFRILGRIGPASADAAGAADATELSLLLRCASEVRRAAGGDRDTAAALLRMRLSELSVAAPPAGKVIELVGFAELNWRRESGLTIAGCNEEFFHPSDGADPMLPEAARRLLGMIVADRWYAVDALRFGGLCASRDLRFLCGRASGRGDILRPPRLLLQVPEEELPGRVEAFFSDRLLEAADAALPAPAGPWLRPHRVEPQKTMRITGFRRYLESPFHFYLEQVLGAAECDERAFEMDNMQFGTLTHAVLEEYAKRGAALEREEDIREFCFAELEAVARRKFGGAPAGLPRLQLDLMRDSLRYFAAVQAERRAAGWRIVGAETSVACDWQELLLGALPEIEPCDWRAGILLKGKIDRIDFLPGDPDRGEPERYVILDYKTGAKAKAPAETHLGALHEEWRRAEGLPVRSGRGREWTDLQLPLYRLLLAGGRVGGVLPGDGARISAAYFDLPLELTATGLREFPELDEPETFRSALLCADELLRRIFAERLFWPPVAPPSLPGTPESLYRFAPDTVMSPEFWLSAAGEERDHE